MKRNLWILFLLMFGWFAPSEIRCQTITQDVFLEQLRQTHPVFEKESFTAQIEQEDRNSMMGAQDWKFYSTLSVMRETPELAIAGPERTDALSGEIGIEKTFWSTGARLTSSFSTGKSSFKIDPLLSSMYGIPESFYSNKIALTYSHPLLQNYKGFLDKLPYRLKAFDVDFSKIQALENQENFLTEAALKFVDWVLLSEQIGIIAERVKLNQEELERTERKRAANLVDEVDVIRATDAVRIAKQNYVMIEAKLNALQSELAVLTQNNQLLEMEPEYALYQFQPLPSMDESIRELQNDSRILRSLQIRLDQLNLARKGFANTKKANLSVFTQMNTKQMQEDVAKSLHMDKYDILAGLQFSVPLENTTAESKINQTDLQIHQLDAQKEETELTMIALLSSLMIQIEKTSEVIRLNEEQIESAKARTREELKYYNQGRGSLTFVILSRDNEENARLQYAQNAALYHQLLIQYRSLMDKIL